MREVSLSCKAAVTSENHIIPREIEQVAISISYIVSSSSHILHYLVNFWRSTLDATLRWLIYVEYLGGCSVFGYRVLRKLNAR